MAKRMIYKTADGKRVPGVTTILGKFKEPGGLMYWANQQGLDGLTLQEARNQPALAGTLAHDLVEAHINGWPEPEMTASAETIAQARKGLENFINWKAQSRIAFQHTEVNLVSEEHRVGGRMDAVGLEPGATLMMPVDFKTGSFYAEHLVQVAAYRLMWNENYPDNPLANAAHLIGFRRETGDFHHAFFDNLDDAARAFVLLRECYDIYARLNKRVK